MPVISQLPDSVSLTFEELYDHFDRHTSEEQQQFMNEVASIRVNPDRQSLVITYKRSAWERFGDKETVPIGVLRPRRLV